MGLAVTARRVLPALTGRQSLSAEIVDVLRQRIYAGDFEPGERLVEAVLAEQLQASRGPVREALALLKAEGLVGEQPRRGHRVVDLTADDVREILELRAAIEGRAAQKLARDDTKRDQAVRELEGTLERLLEVSRAGDIRRAIELDLVFHEALCRLSRNRRVHAAFLAYAPVIRTLFRLDSTIAPPSEMTAEQHRPIVEAIKSGDPTRAQRAIEEHMDTAERLLEEYLARRARELAGQP